MSAIGGIGCVPHWIAPCHSMSTGWWLTAEMCVLGWKVMCFSTFGCPRLERVTGRGVWVCGGGEIGGKGCTWALVFFYPFLKRYMYWQYCCLLTCGDCATSLSWAATCLLMHANSCTLDPHLKRNQKSCKFHISQHGKSRKSEHIGAWGLAFKPKGGAYTCQLCKHQYLNTITTCGTPWLQIWT